MACEFYLNKAVEKKMSYKIVDGFDSNEDTKSQF